MESLVKEPRIFDGVYNNRRILITGHTGFKGSWLALWLMQLNARITGCSLYMPSRPCHFDIIEMEADIDHCKLDIRNLQQLQGVFERVQPEIVFHLAAQPIVRTSYDEPKTTFDTNLGGTVNVLECIRNTPSVRAAVMITSDKCYQNVEWEWGYRENDRLGGDDPYSASKACAELACHAYHQSFFRNGGTPRISTARAGNVIGGGDWARDRIVPDCIRSLAQGKPIVLRSPAATRPWQHVLEPLSGYLWLGARLFQGCSRSVGQAFNFGPDKKEIRLVSRLVERIIEQWGDGHWRVCDQSGSKKESELLTLSCDKALARLGWHAILDFETTVDMTVGWYKLYFNKVEKMRAESIQQIGQYTEMAIMKGLPWTLTKVHHDS